MKLGYTFVRIGGRKKISAIVRPNFWVRLDWRHSDGTANRIFAGALENRQQEFGRTYRKVRPNYFFINASPANCTGSIVRAIFQLCFCLSLFQRWLYFCWCADSCSFVSIRRVGAPAVTSALALLLLRLRWPGYEDFAFLNPSLQSSGIVLDFSL